MKTLTLHPWDVSIQQARTIQSRLAPLVLSFNTLKGPPQLIAGIDISPPSSNGIARCAVVVLEYPAMHVREVVTAQAALPFPYVPGLLSFRETPIVLQALQKLSSTPDVLILDGQGLAHPRRFGIACHVGLLADTPSIGCAKSLLVGSHGPLQSSQGASAPLLDNGETIGAALRTRTAIRPVYVSIGHKIDLPTASAILLACCRGHRIPEPTRLAHLAASGSLPHPTPQQRLV